MRFLLFPNFRHPFEFRILDAFRHALVSLGHEAFISWRPAHEHVVARMAHSLSADVVFQVNRPRPSSASLPSSVRHITWIQDARKPLLDALAATARDGDIVYEMHPLEGLLGYKSTLPVMTKLLAPGVDRRLVAEIPPDTPQDALLDFVMVGTIMKPMHADHREDTLAFDGQDFETYRAWLLRKAGHHRFDPRRLLVWLGARAEYDRHYSATVAKTAMELGFQPLGGEANYETLAGLVGDALQDAKAQNRNSEIFRITYARLLSRATMARYMLDISEKVRFYGNYWDEHEEFRDYHAGFAQHHGEIVRINRSAKIVVHENPDGCNYHDRVLYAMGSGAFVMVPKSKWDTVEDGFAAHFDADRHFGQYTRDDFHDRARYWLKSDKERKARAEAAREAVLKNHTYEHRAEQVLADLET